MLIIIHLQKTLLRSDVWIAGKRSEGNNDYLCGMMIFECCCQTSEDAMEARRGGASRVELCVRLEVGGVTPSRENISQTVKVCGLPVNVLVRPREGNFVYDCREERQIIDAVCFCKSLNVNGIVVGALTKDGDVDLPLMTRIMAAASPLEVTFHRAFDECRNPREALEDIIWLGCKRLLTSGQEESAIKGRLLIKELVHQAAGRIIIMPGAGIMPVNILQLARVTGAVEYHGSARGTSGRTDREVVRRIVDVLSDFDELKKGSR